MAFQINPNIPLQAMDNPINIGESFARAQTYQANALKLQALRDEYNAAKEEKLRQKQMRQGMASELQKLQQGTPAQYAPETLQSMPMNQAPVNANQWPTGQRQFLQSNVEQPKLYDTPVSYGEFSSGGEMVSPAVAGRTPDLKDYLEIQLKTAIANQDPDLAFDAFKKLKELEKNPTKYFGGLTKGVDPKTNKPLFLAMTESGVVPVDGYQPYEEPMSAKEVKANDLAERKFRAEQAQRQRQYDLDYKKYIADLNKPAPIDPVQKAGEIADARADAAVRKALIGDAANVVKTYNIMSPMIDSAISIVKNLPPDMLQSKYQSMLAGTPLNKYLGNPEQQTAITDYNLMLENLRLYIEKPAGAISNYEQGLLGKAIGILEGNYSNEQKESVLKQVKGIFDNQKNVAENVLKQNKADKFIYGNNEQNNKPLRFKKESTSQQRKEYAEAIMAAQGDSELIREIQEHARELGVLE